MLSRFFNKWIFFLKRLFSSRSTTNKVNLMLLGAAKSGTTSLSYYLSLHPDISLGDTKEIHYFDWQYHNTEEWYHSNFKTKSKFWLDATPYYLFMPTAPQRVKDYNPDCKFIILFRDPVNRAISHYYHNIRIKSIKEKELQHLKSFLPFDEDLPIMDSFLKEEERTKAQYEKVEENRYNRSFHSHELQHFSYKARGYYADQLKRWYEFFPKENFLLLDFDELTQSPKESVRKVYKFLNITPVFPKKFDQINKGEYSTSKELESVRALLKKHYESYDQSLIQLTGRKFNWMK